MTWTFALSIAALILGGLVAYSGIDDWQAVLVPALESRSGRDFDPAAWDEDWDEDDYTLSWGEVEGEDPEIEVEEPEFVTAPGAPPRYDFKLPNEPDPGFAQADRTAATRGVNPGRKGGSGQLFSLARSFLGTPYVFGAASPDAFDCSGFVKYLYGRVYGVELPHSAAGQSSMSKKISREQLQPGDLIFYSYGRLGKGAVDHVEVYMGGDRQIGTSNTTEDLDIDRVDWDNVASFGRVANVKADPMLPKAKSKVVTKTREVPQDRSSVPARLAGSENNALALVLAGALTADAVVTKKRRWKTPEFKGNEGGIKAQLYRGFLDAGREDLARMVGTRDFATWIRAESGWDPGVTSPANNHGKPNDGLFQIWRGHEYNARGQVARMSPYEQAQLVAQYFSHLTPEAIRTYAAEIRAGRYHGWG